MVSMNNLSEMVGYSHDGKSIGELRHAGKVVWSSGVRIGDLQVGQKVVSSEAKFEGKPITWLVVAKNHEGYPSNTVTLMSNEILVRQHFDAPEPNNSDSNRKNFGNNRYKNSNIFQWLNTSGSNWYKAQHDADAPPSYESSPGFLTGFSDNFIKQIVETTVPTTPANVDGGGTENVTGLVHLASETEMGFGGNEGNHFSEIFVDNDSRIAQFNGINNQYWLRTAYASNSYNVRNVNSYGSRVYIVTYYYFGGVRPILNLNYKARLFEVVQ